MSSRLSSKHDDIAAADESIAAIETTIARLQTQLITMKKERNRLTPLYRLPDELLSRILFYTQACTLTDRVGFARSRLYDFDFDPQWEKAILASARIYQIAISTPKLWAYVSIEWPESRVRKYAERAGAAHMTVQWEHDLDSLFLDEYGDEIEKYFNVPNALANRYFQRSSAVNLSLFHLTADEKHTIAQAIDQLAPDLLTLHVNLWEEDASFLESLKNYPALTELSIENGQIIQLFGAQFLQLTRLHMESINISSQVVTDILQNTPNLSELLFDMVSDWNHETMSVLKPPEHSLLLPQLRKLLLYASPGIIRDVLTLLSLNVPYLQEVHINDLAWSGTQEPTDNVLFEELFVKAMGRWHSMGLPLPPATWICNSHYKNVSWLYLNTPSDSDRLFQLRIRYSPDLLALYQQHNIVINTVEINNLGADLDSSRWNTSLHEFQSRHLQHLKRLRFTGCAVGVPGLESWIRAQHAAGQIIQRVTFVRCQGTTLKDYEALKESGLIEELEWDEGA
jgi:hypothetical protein